MEPDEKGRNSMPFGKDDVAFLESIDTPTVCNVIEIVAPSGAGMATPPDTCIVHFPIFRLK